MSGEFIDRFVEGLPSSFVAGVEAQRLLQETPASILNAWFNDRDVRAAVLTQEIVRRSRKLPVQEERAAFGKSAAKFTETGDADEFLDRWGVTHAVNEENLRKSESIMVAADHKFVAAAYEVRGNRNLMLAEFHRAVAKKLDDRRTDEVFDPETYRSMKRSIVGDDE